MERIEEADLWKTKMYEKELEAVKANAEAVLAKFQAHLDALWAKYNLVKNQDQVWPDGTIVRAK